MVAIVSLLLVLYMSLFVTRIATLILVHTGLSRQVARFQARSAMTGCGFTTSEAEQMLKHPLRRRVVMTLMLIGHIGIVATMSAAILGFVSTKHTQDFLIRAGTLLAGVLLLWFLSKSSLFEKSFERLLSKILKDYTDIRADSLFHLCHLEDNYKVIEFRIFEGHFLVNKTVGEIDFHHYGVTLLGIQQMDGTYLGVPQRDTKLMIDQVLILYGCKADLEEFCKHHGNKTSVEDE